MQFQDFVIKGTTLVVGTYQFTEDSCQRWQIFLQPSYVKLGKWLFQKEHTNTARIRRKRGKKEKGRKAAEKLTNSSAFKSHPKCDDKKHQKLDELVSL